MGRNWRRKLAAFLTLVFLLTELPVVKSVAADYTEMTYEAATATLYLAGEISGKEDINDVLTAAGVSRSDVKKVVSLPGTKISGYCASIFAFSEAESIDLSNVDSSGCTDMRMMFAGSSKVKKLDVSMLDTSSVNGNEGFLRMFTDCESLEEITFGGKFSTAKASKLTSFFSGCASLKSIDFSKLSTGGAWDMSHFLDGCSSLKSVDTEHLSIASVYGRGLAGFFTDCASLTELDLSMWSTSGIDIMANLFSGCSSLKTIYVGEGWRVGQVSESPRMFSGCVSLVGGEGTVFDASAPVDKTRAHIDQGEVNPGYLTRKGAVPEKKELTTVAIRCDAVNGEYSKVYNYTGEPIVPKEIWVYEYFNGFSSYKFMEASDYYKEVTDNIEPGMGKITVYPTEHGRYTFDPVTLQFPIGKAKVYDKEKSVNSSRGTEDSVSINSLLEEEGLEAGIQKVNDSNGIFDGTPTLEDGRLKWKINENEELIGKKGYIIVNVPESDHYKAYTITVTVTVVKKQDVYPESVVISESELNLKVNETYQLSAYVLPENAKNREIRWTSGNSNIAKVDDTGLVTAVDEGTIKIYAASQIDSSIWAECAVTVSKEKTDPGPGPGPDPEPEEPKAEVIIGTGEATDPQPTIDEDTTKIYLVEGQQFYIGKGWSSSGSRVLSIRKTGMAKAKKTGTVTLTFGEKRSIEAVITPFTITGKISLEAGTSQELALNYDTEHLKVRCFSSAPDVATIDDELRVHAHSKGKAKITAIVNGVSRNCTVTVGEQVYGKEHTLHLNLTKTKNVKIKGLAKTEWVLEEGSEEGVVDIIKGSKVKALKPGTVTLVCGDYKLNVIAEDPSISGSSKPYSMKAEMKVGETKPVSLTAVEQDVFFKSSKGSVAYMDAEGVIHARSKGKAKLSAKVNGRTISISVTVK